LASARRNVLVLTCEHCGCDIPRAYAAFFADHEALAHSHRGWDAGALELGRQMADSLGVPLHAATTTRLLVDLNRSIGHRQLFSEVTRPLSAAHRREIVDRYYLPHRQEVEGEVARQIAAGARVIHVASHSFTPRLDGVERRADVAWLYDPQRPGEAVFVRAWMMEFAQRAPGLRLRRNYPYRGHGDGLTAWLRKRHPDETYVGIELEVNQGIIERGGAPWDELRAKLIDALAKTLAGASIEAAS
jgi:predicted N-formylglutamate amidohydrolase